MEIARSAAVVLLAAFLEKYRRAHASNSLMQESSSDSDLGYYDAVLSKSVIEKWWTKLFPDKFSDDYADVYIPVKQTPMEFKGMFDIDIEKYNSDSFSYECLRTLAQATEIEYYKKTVGDSRGCMVSKTSFEGMEFFLGSIFDITKSMSNIITEYFACFCVITIYREKVT